MHKLNVVSKTGSKKLFVHFYSVWCTKAMSGVKVQNMQKNKDKYVRQRKKIPIIQL